MDKIALNLCENTMLKYSVEIWNFTKMWEISQVKNMWEGIKGQINRKKEKTAIW